MEKASLFQEVTVAWAEAYRQGCVRDAIHWFLHKFNVDLVDTLRLMCPAIAPLLNPTAASVHWPKQQRALPFENEDIIMDGQAVIGAASLPCSCRRCFIQS